MLEKLLSLLLHAKAGAISGVFLLCATGALVSVSASNGVTTITITEASPSPSASAHPSASPTATQTRTATPTPSASQSPSSLLSPTSSACADEAKVLSTQVKRVDSAFGGFHTDLMKLRGQRAVATIEKADVLLKQVRQAAAKAIHATMTCKKHDDDEDENDEDESHDATPSTTSLNADRVNDEHKDGDHAKAGTSPITFTGTDPKAIADQAVAAMRAAFDTAKNAPATTPKPSRSPEQKNADTRKHDGKSSEHHD